MGTAGAHIELVKPRERPQPFGTMAQPLRLRQQALLACIRKTFVVLLEQAALRT